MLGFSPYGTATPGEVRGAVIGSGSVITLGAQTALGAAVAIVPTASTPIMVPDLGCRSVKVPLNGQTVPYYRDPRSPNDISIYGMDISGLPHVEAIASVVSVSASPDDLVIGTPSLYGQEIQFLVSAGTSGEEYTITANFRTTTGETYSRSAVLYTVSR